jgi:tRNA (Thr-GGU) A37 N-methylase
LPGQFDAGVYFIGRIRTPWTRREDCPKNPRESDALCAIEIDSRYAQALAGVETCSHLAVLYWVNRARRDLVLQVPRHYGGVGRGEIRLDVDERRSVETVEAVPDAIVGWHARRGSTG